MRSNTVIERRSLIAALTLAASISSMPPARAAQTPAHGDITVLQHVKFVMKGGRIIKNDLAGDSR
jgi:hypothetical protein